MSAREYILEKILKVEGGYVDNPNDSGGATNYGITERVARNWGYSGSMGDFKLEDAIAIYQSQYLDTIKFDSLARISEITAREVADTAVNMGVKVSSKFLQRSLRLLTGHKLVIDGIIGDKTIAALSEYVARRKSTGEVVLVKMLNCLQGQRYIKIAERRPKDRVFIFGWFRTRIGL